MYLNITNFGMTGWEIPNILYLKHNLTVDVL
jgi:hypothetical protein